MAQAAFTMYKLAAQGFCCSQILLLMDFTERKVENPEIIRAMEGLCVGIGATGRICGVLTGGACLLGLYAGKGKAEEARSGNLNKMILEYSDWFEEENESTECHDIVGIDSLEDIRKSMVYPVKCGNLINKSYKKIKEILKDYNYFDEGVE